MIEKKVVINGSESDRGKLTGDVPEISNLGLALLLNCFHVHDQAVETPTWEICRCLKHCVLELRVTTSDKSFSLQPSLNNLLK